MSIHIAPRGRDDPGFIRQINRVLAGLVRRIRPREVFVIQVADAFGDRWCGTGGKFLGKRDAQTVVSRASPKLPPFEPGRVEHEQCFRLALDLTSYIVTDEFEPLHVHGLSGREYQRDLSRFTEAGAFVWYSGETMDSGVGTALVQIVTPEFSDVWHVTFGVTAGEWSFVEGLGITRDQFETY
jgi:hypothetical protein